MEIFVFTVVVTLCVCGFVYTQASAESLEKHAERERELDEAAGSAQVRLHACIALPEAVCRRVSRSLSISGLFALDRYQI